MILLLLGLGLERDGLKGHLSTRDSIVARTKKGSADETMNSTKLTTSSRRRLRSGQLDVIQLNGKILATIRIRRPGGIEIELGPKIRDVAAVCERIKYRLLEAGVVIVADLEDESGKGEERASGK